MPTRIMPPVRSAPLPLLLCLCLGLLFLTQSYAFYNINHYKLVLALGSAFFLTVLALTERLPHFVNRAGEINTGELRGIERRDLVLLLLPLLATLPGFFFSGGQVNYFLAQELATWLVCCAWLLLLLIVLQGDGELRLVVFALSIILLSAACIGIFNYLGKTEGFSLDVLNREAGSFGNPNYLAAYLLLQLPLLLLCLLSRVGFGLAGNALAAFRWLVLAALVVGVLALFLTQTRAAQILFLVNLALLFALMFWRPGLYGMPRKHLMQIAAAGVVAVLVLLILFPVIDYLLERIRLGSTSASRLVPWQAAWASIQDAPLLGWGPGSSYSLFFEYVDPASRLDWFERRYVHPHNEYLELLQEGGLLALSAYCLLMAYFCHIAYRLFRNEGLRPQYKILLTGLCLGILSYHLLALVSVAQRMISVRLILFLQLAIILWLRNRVSTPDQPGAGKRRSRYLGATATLVTALAMLLLSGALYYQDGSSRFRYVSILQSSQGPERREALRQLRDQNPNIYALETLIQDELASGEFKSAQHSLAVMSELIPHYDGSGYLAASAALLQDRLGEARRLALDYQARDRYHTGTAALLGKIALFSDDPALLGRQLGLLLTSLMVNDPAFPGPRPRLSIAIVGSGNRVVFMQESTPPELQVEIEQAALTGLIAAGRAALLSLDDPIPRRRFDGYLEALLAAADFDNLNDAQQELYRTSLHAGLDRILSRDL